MSDPGQPGTRPRRRLGGPSRWRTALVLLPLLVGLGVAAYVGGTLLWPTLDEKASGTDSSGPTCWDGTQVEAAEECPLPTGRAGLRHVFPSFTPGRLECRNELAEDPALRRPTMWTCDQGLSRPFSVTYSQMSDLGSARRSLRRLHGGPGAAERTDDGQVRERWAATRVAGSDPQLFSGSILLRGAPYAVTVTAPRRADVRRALDRVIEVRPVEGLRLSP